MNKIISRDKAISKNLRVFRTGKPCNRGHNVCRYTSNGACVDCIKIYTAKHTVKTIKKLIVYLHPDDVAVVQKYVDSLNFARKINLGFYKERVKLKRKRVK